jgi:hypothetical protein
MRVSSGMNNDCCTAPLNPAELTTCSTRNGRTFPSATINESKTFDDQNVAVVRMRTRIAAQELLNRPHFAGDKNWQVETWVTGKCGIREKGIWKLACEFQQQFRIESRHGHTFPHSPFPSSSTLTRHTADQHHAHRFLDGQLRLFEL